MRKLGKKKKDTMRKMLDTDAEFHDKSYELGLAHGKTRAIYLIKLCLDGYKEAYADKDLAKHFPDDDEITIEHKRQGIGLHADACEFVLGFVHSQWDDDKEEQE